MGADDGIVWFLRVNDRQVGSVRVLALEGRISHATLNQVRDALRSGVTDPRHVILDLAGVDYVNGDGLRLLEEAARRLRQSGGGLAVCGLRPVLKTLFELAGPIPHLAVEESVETATGRL